MARYENVDWSEHFNNQKMEEETGQTDPVDKPLFDDVDEDDNG